ncbi:flavodoxin [Vibrio azureus]|uniref:Putative flavoprotein n=1 Tax=Vibrio azureus NBRC 104587 TaxID=1219077 RepID=U3A3B1_9VIBR|nr:flavodoxin family protein [Vibrio azureus]AUI87524.1 flavodoxin [Vibrio azureus]GAD74491.1 putative flavoprotein [Vibrio azureus NBRC 104587]
MSKIAIIYFSKTQATAKLARSIESGIVQHGEHSVLSHQIQGSEIIEGRFSNPELMQQLADCAAIIFGSPTYMGGVAAQFKAFADASSGTWSKQKWTNKLAAGFTCGGSLNGDQSMTLQYLQTLSSQHGMLWVSLGIPSNSGEQGLNRLGTQAGIVAQNNNGKLHHSDLATAHYLGNRIAELVSAQADNTQANK